MRIFDRAQQSQPFMVAPIADPESLTDADVAALAIITEQLQWIVVVDATNQVRGVIEPQHTKEVQITASAIIKSGEFSIPELYGKGVRVSVSFYGCPKHPEVGRFALHEVGAPIPCCPKDGEAMVELEKRGERTDVMPHAQMVGGKKGWFARLFSRGRKA